MRRPTISKSVVKSMKAISDVTDHAIIGPMMRGVIGPDATRCVKEFGLALDAWYATRPVRRQVANAATPKAEWATRSVGKSVYLKTPELL